MKVKVKVKVKVNVNVKVKVPPISGSPSPVSNVGVSRSLSEDPTLAASPSCSPALCITPPSPVTAAHIPEGVTPPISVTAGVTSVEHSAAPPPPKPPLCEVKILETRDVSKPEKILEELPDKVPEDCQPVLAGSPGPVGESPVQGFHTPDMNPDPLAFVLEPGVCACVCVYACVFQQSISSEYSRIPSTGMNYMFKVFIAFNDSCSETCMRVFE